MINNFKKYLQIYEKNLEEIIDFTIIKPSTTEEDVEKACEIAKDKNFHSICILPDFIEDAKDELEDTHIDICVFLDLRKGGVKNLYKKLDDVLSKDIDEIDLLLDIKKIKTLDELSLEGDENYEEEYEEYLKMLSKISTKCRKEGVILKLIIEIGELTIGQLKLYSKLIEKAGIEFIQTSSGLYPNGSDYKKVKLLRRILPDYINIKIAGGIHTEETALKYRELVDRIGTSRQF